jgi:hypothetical protein
MKIKHPNFNHLSSSGLEPTYVPAHLIRKHWSLQMVEMYQLIICIAMGIYIFGAISEKSYISVILCAAFLMLFLSATILSIMDNHHSKKVTLLAHMSFIVGCFVAGFLIVKLFLLFVIPALPSLLVIFIVTIPARNKMYYEWCKSIAQ